LEGNALRAIRRDIVARGTMELKKFLRSRVEPPGGDGGASGEGPTSGGGASSANRQSNPSAAAFASDSDASTGVFRAEDSLDFFTIKSSKIFDYSNKQTSSLPPPVVDELYQCELLSLDLSKNVFTEFPDNIFHWEPSLTSLSLAFNRFTSCLSSEIGKFTRLQTIDLRNNQLTDLPESLSNLTRLREITLSVNRFVALPSVLFNIPTLETILAADNRITEIPIDDLRKMNNLQILDLQNNSIGQVPPELSLLPALRALELSGNTFRQPRPNVLAKGSAAVIEYLKSRIVV